MLPKKGQCSLKKMVHTDCYSLWEGKNTSSPTLGHVCTYVPWLRWKTNLQNLKRKTVSCEVTKAQLNKGKYYVCADKENKKKREGACSFSFYQKEVSPAQVEAQDSSTDSRVVCGKPRLLYCGSFWEHTPCLTSTDDVNEAVGTTFKQVTWHSHRHLRYWHRSQSHISLRLHEWL